MTSIKVKTKDGIVGYVATKHWADPNIYLMDFQVAENGVDSAGEKTYAGDTFPKYREDLVYLGLAEY